MRDAQATAEVPAEEVAGTGGDRNITQGNADEAGDRAVQTPGAWRMIDFEMDRENSMFVYTLSRAPCVVPGGAKGVIC